MKAHTHKRYVHWPRTIQYRLMGQVNTNSCLLDKEAADRNGEISVGTVVGFLYPFAADHEGFLRSKQIERRKFSCQTKQRSTLSRSTGPLSRSARKFTGHTTSPSGTPATMPRRTASAAAPRPSFGSVTVFAPAARSTLPVRRFPSTRLSAARKTSLPLVTRWPTTHRLRSPSLWIRNCSTLYTTS